MSDNHETTNYFFSEGFDLQINTSNYDFEIAIKFEIKCPTI